MTDINYSEMTAIVIDDQEFVRIIVARMLSQFGFGKVVTAVDGGTGFDAVVANKPDIIICDIAMKPIGGMEFLERLRREAEGPVALTPVIFLTGGLDPETVVKAKSLGVDSLVLKPIPPKKLRAKIEAVLAKQRVGEGTEGEE